MAVMTKLQNMLFGAGGGMRTSELAQKRDVLSEHLPWIAFDEDDQFYYNQDSTIGFLWECMPLNFSTENVTKSLEGFLNAGLPDGSVAQFVLHAEPFIGPWLDSYKSLKTRNGAIVEQSAQRFSEYLNAGVTGMKHLSGNPIRDFRLMVAVKLAPGEGSRFSKAELGNLRSGLYEQLVGAKLAPVTMPPEKLLLWARRLFNDEDIGNDYWDKSLPIRKQILRANVSEIEFDAVKIGEKIFRCITPQTCPGEIDLLQVNQLLGGIWGMGSDNDQINAPFIYSLNIIYKDMRGALHRKCNHVLMQQGWGSFAPSLARKKDEFTRAADELEKGTRFLRIMPTLWIYGSQRKKVDEAVKRTRRIWEKSNYVMQEDKGILSPLFIASMPFGLYNLGNNVENLKRYFDVPASTAAAMAPVQADFAGGGKPVVMGVGRKGQIINLDLFDKSAKAHNAYIAASTGSGKSYFVNYLAANYYGCGAKIRIIDIGGSYRKLSRMFQGKFLEFSPKSRISLNPFTHLGVGGDEMDEGDKPEKQTPIIASFFGQMAFSSTGETPDNTEMSLLKDGVRFAWKQRGNEAEVDDVWEYLKTYPLHAGSEFSEKISSSGMEDIKGSAHKLAFNLKDFMRDGQYGQWFNGPSNFNITDDDFVVLELEELESQPELFKVATMLIINSVTQDLYLGERERPTLIIFDEAWKFLKKGGIMLDVIEDGYRRARKYYGSFTVITQSILDLESYSNAGRVIMNNSDFRFFLQADDYEQAKKAKLIEYDDFTMQILKSVRKNTPKYSEIFMDTPFGVGVMRLMVDPFSNLIYTSDPKENREIEKIVTNGKSYEEAISEIITRNGGG